MINEGQVIKDKYKIIRQLGQGGMAQVWLAEEINFRNRQVAIKAPRPGLSEMEGSILSERFKREVNVCADLVIAKSPHVVQALTYDAEEESGFLVMEYMPGGDLEHRINDHPDGIPIEDVIKIAKEILTALDGIHNHPLGIIHRDIKPSNILFSAKGEACLGDFGLAQMSKTSGLLPDVLSGQTLVFTPRYRAPELDNPNAYINAAADIFSFGCVMWEMVTGKVYKDYGKPASTYYDQVPDWLDDILTRCLEENPRNRFLIAREITDLIDKHQDRSEKKTTKKAKTEKTEPRIAFIRDESNTSSKDEPELGIGLTMVSEKDGMTMVYVPAGEFLIGSKDDDLDAGGHEKPQHTVFLDAYWIDQTPVTNAMYAKFLNEMGNKEEGGSSWLTTWSKISESNGVWKVEKGLENHPVVGVTWYGARVYSRWAGRDLPTEAQWEKAARGTDGRTYPWGEGFSCKCANTKDSVFFPQTYPVDYHPKGASLYGALDMAGNVWEWVRDWYASDYYKNAPRENPQGPSHGENRVLRGGSWIDDGWLIRSALRYYDFPSYSSSSLGFRCALLP